jgi:hypothetical protein
MSATCAEKYKVIVRKNSKTGPRVFKAKLAETRVKTDKLQRDKKYFWRVRARNDEGKGKWSSWWKFKILAE